MVHVAYRCLPLKASAVIVGSDEAFIGVALSSVSPYDHETEDEFHAGVSVVASSYVAVKAAFESDNVSPVVYDDFGSWPDVNASDDKVFAPVICVYETVRVPSWFATSVMSWLPFTDISCAVILSLSK
jgi:hypothetical protein